MCILIVAVFFTAIGLAIFGPAIFSLLKQLRPLKRLRDSRAVRASADRHRVRVAFASIWTNALGLGLIAAVIFIVGASHLGFEVWRYYAGEVASSSTASLEELLQKKLPDPEIQQRQHRELVGAIQKWRPPDTILVPTDNEANKAEFLKLERVVERLERAAKERFANVDVLRSAAGWVVLSLFATGGALFIRSFFATSTPRRVLEIAAAAALTVPSIFGGLKLANDLKTDFTAIGEMGGIHFNFQWGKSEPPGPKPPKPADPKPLEPREVDVYLHLDVARGEGASSTLMDCGQDGERVGPFGIGTITLDENDTKKLTTFAKSLKELTKDKSNRLTAIVLIGSADKRPLKPKTASLYSSNAGLAQARIAVVRKALKGESDTLPRIMEFYAGPEMTDAKLPSDALSSDRSVKICLLWDRKS
jgi:hypothetical protein